MKQNLANRPLTSREYKMMLVPSEFNNIEKGIDKILQIVDSQIGDNVRWTKDIREGERKRTCFLDTTDFAIVKSNKFIGRIGQGLTTGEGIMIDTYLPPMIFLAKRRMCKLNLKKIYQFHSLVSSPYQQQFSLSATLRKIKCLI
jgi:hypothetical protein